MKNKKILLIMPSFWDPICPPQGIVCLKSYLESLGHKVHIRDFNTDARLFGLQRKYFELGLKHFPQWKFLNIFRNGPRYFVRHQLAWLFGRQQGAKYEKLVSLILNFDGKSVCTKEIVNEFDVINAEIFSIVRSKTEEIMNQLDPDIVGCTMLESTFPSALVILKKVKEISPRTKTLLGGPGPLVGDKIEHGNLQRIIERYKWIDTIICNEGEYLFENYLKGNLGNKRIIQLEDLKDYKDFKDLLVNVEDIPKPNYDGLDVKRYLWLSLFTSRGCPFNCAFCVENKFWRRYRKKSAEKILYEIKETSKKYKNNKFYLCDSLVNPVVNQLSDSLQGGGYEYDSYMRITKECLSNDKVKRWANSGMQRVRIGVESTSQRVLGLMNKGITVEDIKKSLKNFAENGIYTTTLWIAGFPGERDEDFLESVEFLKKNHKNIYEADIWEFICFPEGFDEHKAVLAYPEEFNDILPLRYYELGGTLTPSERFERISKFEKMRIKLGIPNPYSLIELLKANERWYNLGHVKE